MAQYRGAAGKQFDKCRVYAESFPGLKKSFPYQESRGCAAAPIEPSVNGYCAIRGEDLARTAGPIGGDLHDIADEIVHGWEEGGRCYFRPAMSLRAQAAATI